ncbi:hypothetical protein J6590_053103 [Homalodisca vitripennis]|nr:hypothetical protein J6590_053103 [Homalodisca vitripennis]
MSHISSLHTKDDDRVVEDDQIQFVGEGGITKIKNRKKKRRERKGFKHSKSCLESSPGVVTAENASPEHKVHLLNAPVAYQDSSFGTSTSVRSSVCTFPRLAGLAHSSNYYTNNTRTFYASSPHEEVLAVKPDHQSRILNADISAHEHQHSLLLPPNCPFSYLLERKSVAEESVAGDDDKVQWRSNNWMNLNRDRPKAGGIHKSDELSPTPSKWADSGLSPLGPSLSSDSSCRPRDKAIDN